MTEDEVVEWHYQFNGHELGQAPGDGEGQGGLVCYSPGDLKVGHDLATEQQLQVVEGGVSSEVCSCSRNGVLQRSGLSIICSPSPVLPAFPQVATTPRLQKRSMRKAIVDSCPDSSLAHRHLVRSVGKSLRVPVDSLCL